MANFGPPTPFAHDDLVDLLRRNFDESWIDGLLNDPSSKSFFEALIAVMLRVQTAVDENFGKGPFILSAPGLAHAVSTLRIQRPSGGAVTIPTTMRVRDQRGAVWTPIADFAVGASGGPQTVDVPIETQRGGYFLNSFLPLTYVFLDKPPDPNFVIVAGVDPASEGTSPFLDLLGDERDKPRATGEDDDLYRHRVLFLEDQVSPFALGQALFSVIDSLPISRALSDLIVKTGYRPVLEPFVDVAHTAAFAFFGDQTLFFDDPFYGFCDDPHGPVLRELADALRWLDVEIPVLADPTESRFFFDNGFLDDPLLGFPDQPPGVLIDQFFGTLADELDRKREGGVGIRILYENHVSLVRHPPDVAHGGGVQAGNWTPGGTNAPADLIAAVQAPLGDASFALSTVGAGGGAGSSPNDLVYGFAPPSTYPSAIDFVRLIVVVKRVDKGVQIPSFQFVLQASGAAVRVGTPVVVSNTLWQRFDIILERNPSTNAAWVPANLLALSVGIANVSVGATDDLRVCDLAVEVRASYE